MKKIGFDKRDSEFRKFYFDDDEITSTNPPKYIVKYIDNEKDIDYIECDNVFYLKPANIQDNKNKEIDTDKSLDFKKSEIEIKSEPKHVQKKSEVDIKSEVKEEQPKKKRTYVKKKSVEKEETIVKEKKFDKIEYKVIDEAFTSDDDIQNMLNTYGEEGWELCGFDIYHTGLVKSNTNIICILKKWR